MCAHRRVGRIQKIGVTEVWPIRSHERGSTTSRPYVNTENINETHIDHVEDLAQGREMISLLIKVAIPA